MYLHKKKTIKIVGYNVLIMFILYCKTLLQLLRWDTGKIRDSFSGIGRLRGKGRVNGVIVDVITEVIYSCNYGYF